MNYFQYGLDFLISPHGLVEKVVAHSNIVSPPNVPHFCLPNVYTSIRRDHADEIAWVCALPALRQVCLVHIDLFRPHNVQVPSIRRLYRLLNLRRADRHTHYHTSLSASRTARKSRCSSPVCRRREEGEKTFSLRQQRQVSRGGRRGEQRPVWCKYRRRGYDFGSRGGGRLGRGDGGDEESAGRV